MLDNNHTIQKAIHALSRLPGVGERSAQRMVFQLIQKAPLLSNILQQLSALAEEIVVCKVCNNVDVTSPCFICSNPKRNQQQVCIVEDISSLWALEKSQAFNGVYFVLEGVLKAHGNEEVAEKKVPQLLSLIGSNNVQEVIIATSLTVEGQATTLYLKEEITNINPAIIISTLAQGVPVGGEIDYLDELTLQTALKLRRGL